jgi:cytochrome c-type biogenesis protein CcmE
VSGALLAGAAALVVSSLGDNASYSRSPSEIVVGGEGKPGDRLRIGGLVGVDSISQLEGATIQFEITDGEHGVWVTYDDLTPDLFEEGQGIVAEGVLQSNGVLKASRLVARHDESYMPKEAYDALKAAGGDAAVDASTYSKDTSL